jgi:protein TonB
MNAGRPQMPMPSKPPSHAPRRGGRVAGLGGVIGLHVAALALAWSTVHDTGERASAAAAPVLRVQLLSPAEPPPMRPQPLPRPPLQAPPGWLAELPVPVVAPERAVTAMPTVLPGATVAVAAEAPVPAAATETVQQATAQAPPRQRVAADHSACARVPHPAVLRERGIEGRVQLRVQVGADGRARQVQLQGSSGWRLFDEAALAQVRDCRFRPALEGDAAVESWVEFAVRFALNQS